MVANLFLFALSAVPLTIYSSSLSVVANGNVILLITIFPLLSGISRPILGYISDILGRLTTLLVTLTMMIIGSILFLVNLILPSVLVIGFFGGSLITLYFSIVGDIFGEKFSTSNNAILYTGKAVAGVLGGFTFSLLYDFSPTIAKEFGLISAIAGLLLLLSKTVPMKAWSLNTLSTNLMLRPKEVCQKLGISYRTLQEYVKKDT